jgi:DNA-binding winged helix-turn-helix (wHTH) protein
MRLTFGNVLFDSGTRQVWRNDVEVHLTRHAFDLLALLIERRPNAVSKEEIHARIWPDTFVSESTLQSLVFEIRDVIGDHTRPPRIVRTVHGFGYAFQAQGHAPSAQPAASRRVRGWLIGEVGRLALFDGENVLGREGHDVIVLRSPTVSRRHATITIGDTALVEDLGSKNGTFLGDQPVTGPVPIADGDRLRVGAVLLMFRLPPDGGSTQTAISSPARGR